MTISIIAIKGDHLSKVVEIFETFKYTDLGIDKQFDNLDQTNNYLFRYYEEFANKDIALRAIWVKNDWTIISDPEMVDTIDDDALLKLSNKFNVDVLTFIIQTTSSSFGFAKYNNVKERYFFTTDATITDNFGSPLIEEQGLNINEQIFVDDIIKLAGILGIDMEGKERHSFIIKQLGYNDELKKELEKYKRIQTNRPNMDPKPWWKIW